MWQRIRESFAPHSHARAAVLTVAIGAEGPDRVRTYVDQARATFPTLVDQTGVLSRLHGYRAVLNGVFVDESGMVRYAKYGGFTVHDAPTRVMVERWLHDRDVDVPAADGAETLDPEALRLFEDGLAAIRRGDRESAARARGQAMRVPRNWLIRKQRWTLDHPDRFYSGPADFDCQKKQIARGCRRRAPVRGNPRMNADDLDHGMRLLRELPDVTTERADARVAAIYEDAKSTLRVPVVNFIFRALANDPDFLAAAWARLRPRALMLSFERAADELRAAALLDAPPPDAGADGRAQRDVDAIRRFTETIHYVLPKLLLIATDFTAAVDDAERSVRAKPSLDAQASFVPGVAEGTVSIAMIDPDDASPELARLFEEIRSRHGHPAVATYYRALGHWPEFLRAVWTRLAPHVGSPAYEARRAELLDRAQTALAELGPAPPLGLPLARDRRRDLRALLAVFRLRLAPDLLLDVTLIRAMLDGAAAARVSRFSLARA